MRGQKNCPPEQAAAGWDEEVERFEEYMRSLQTMRFSSTNIIFDIPANRQGYVAVMNPW